MSDFNIETVRSQFPALSEDQVFLDNAGGSQTLGTVIEAIRDYLSRNNVQLGASYKTSKLSTRRYDTGYTAGARYVNAHESDIVFGASTTQLFRNLSFTLPFHEGDEIIVSSIDHEANIAPWVDLASRQKLVLKWWTPSLAESSPPHDTSINPKLTPSSLLPLLTSRTRLVACTHASNLLGTINPIADIAAAIRAGPAPEALFVVDAVSYAPHRPVDVLALGVDAYAFSWYKVYGPHIAMLYASSRARAQMKSLGHFFKKGETLEEQIGLAGASYELLSGIPAVTSYLEHTTWPAIIAQEQVLQAALLHYLTSRPDVTIYGDSKSDSQARVPTISFVVAGWKSSDVVAAIESATNLGFRWGAFYSERLAKEQLGLGDEGVVRVSMVHYNSVAEIEKFIKAMEKYVLRRA
ncbi:aminotransferase class-V [Xylaria sp. CBS 124048]|nr:aminotransferase class-V [Xylaria sp. CBS 124048]